ncbi:hypothetical protein, partial [Solidesulfovibrio sp.]|uniref:hypothetical protein n=1 Tax=Solidesulfovibrio sp. TaxID=2910990 RepID=UPI002B1E9DB0
MPRCPLPAIRFPGRGLLAAVLALGLLLSASAALAKRPKKAVVDARGQSLAAAWLAAPGEGGGLERAVVEGLAGLASRVTGSPGCALAADAVEAYFRGLGAGEIGRLEFRAPVVDYA